jgi:hypothetical protein
VLDGSSRSSSRLRWCAGAEPNQDGRSGTCNRSGIARGSPDARARLPRMVLPASPRSRPFQASGPRHRSQRLSAGRRDAAPRRGRRSPSDSLSKVVALAVQGRRVVDLEEELQQLSVGASLGIEDDLDRLRVPGMIAVGRVRNIAAGVADPRRNDAGSLPEEILHSPETSSGKDRFLNAVAHVPTSSLTRFVTSLPASSWPEAIGNDAVPERGLAISG